MVDGYTPIAHNLLGRWVQETGVKTIVLKGEQDPAFAKPKTATSGQTAPAAPALREPVAAKVPVAIAPPSAPSAPVAPVASPARVSATDLQALANDRSKWPKKVCLIKATTFPAVLNGKVVGSLVAPAGAEANLKSVAEGKVALEFNGGGAWLPIEQTDLIARVQSAN